MSLSARRAWIEIKVVTASDWASVVALRKESVDRNNVAKFLMSCSVTSLSARRAWIEIIFVASITTYVSWSLSARRAWIEIDEIFFREYCSNTVALRKESVDRNLNFLQCLVCRGVALRKESVDRNIDTSKDIIKTIRSLSARRAWIEIVEIVFVPLVNGVALRKESVDRNKVCR